MTVKRELGLRAGPGGALGQARRAGRRRRRSAPARAAAAERTEPSTARSSASVYGLAADGEVGEHAVGARRRGASTGTDQVPSGACGRVQVLEAGHVAPHDDEVHALGVLDVEVAHGPAAAVDDPEGERERLALRRGAARELERQAVSLTARPRTGCGAVISRAIARPWRPPRWPAAGVDVDAAAGERGAGEHERRARRRSRRAWLAALMPSPAAWPRGRGGDVLGRAQQHHAAPSPAASRRARRRISTPMSVDDAGPQQRRSRRTSARTSRPTSPRSPASRGRGSASSRPSARSSSSPCRGTSTRGRR